MEILQFSTYVQTQIRKEAQISEKMLKKFCIQAKKMYTLFSILKGCVYTNKSAFRRGCIQLHSKWRTYGEKVYTKSLFKQKKGFLQYSYNIFLQINIV